MLDRLDGAAAHTLVQRLALARPFPVTHVDRVRPAERVALAPKCVASVDSAFAWVKVERGRSLVQLLARGVLLLQLGKDLLLLKFNLLRDSANVDDPIVVGCLLGPLFSARLSVPHNELVEGKLLSLFFRG